AGSAAAALERRLASTVPTRRASGLIVFELFDAKRSLRAICGGGRYDTLIQEIACVDLPCVGFGMGGVVRSPGSANRSGRPRRSRSEEHTSELQAPYEAVCPVRNEKK